MITRKKKLKNEINFDFQSSFDQFDRGKLIYQHITFQKETETITNCFILQNQAIPFHSPHGAMLYMHDLLKKLHSELPEIRHETIKSERLKLPHYLNYSLTTKYGKSIQLFFDIIGVRDSIRKFTSSK